MGTGVTHNCYIPDELELHTEFFCFAIKAMLLLFLAVCFAVP
ncbi:mCG141713 [Mus musculus]|nr:mCG141713 [Mus musculus]